MRVIKNRRARPEREKARAERKKKQVVILHAPHHKAIMTSFVSASKQKRKRGERERDVGGGGSCLAALRCGSGRERAGGRSPELNHKAMDYKIMTPSGPLSLLSYALSVFISGMLLFYSLLPQVSRSLVSALPSLSPHDVSVRSINLLSLSLTSLPLAISLTKRSHSRGKQ